MTTAIQTSTKEIAQFLVENCLKGDYCKVVDTYYCKDIVNVESMEMPDFPKEVKGLEAVKAKNKEWMANTEIHSQSISEPLIAGNQFAVKFTLDATCKKSNERMTMEEIGVYSVENGKITRAQFFYDACKG